MAVMVRRRLTFSEQAERVLEALKACGPGWHSRGDIAAQMGKQRLNPEQVPLLAYLAEKGRIEAEQHEIEGPIPVRWEYCVIDEPLSQYEKAQIEKLIEQYRALQDHLPADYEATQRELRKIEKELKTFGFKVGINPDGNFFPALITKGRKGK